MSREDFDLPRENRYMVGGLSVPADDAHLIWPRLLDAKYDRFFKSVVTAGWAVKSDGNVESPAGYFALVEVPSNENEYIDMLDAVEPDADRKLSWADYMTNWESALPVPGWYVTSELSTGLIYVMQYPFKADAEKAYAELEENFSEWDADDGD